ncbi:hypothetical protein B566_EDAN002635 [Ephemera danica]|nr:hypothetical protein B566_EDAN002635 [Ephemera danica]
MFVESLLTRAVEITSARNAKTLTPSHMKQCILSESRFDFLKEFVKTVPDLVGDTDDCPGPSGGPFLASSSMEESNPCSEPYSSTEHTKDTGRASELGHNFTSALQQEHTKCCLQHC